MFGCRRETSIITLNVVSRDEPDIQVQQVINSLLQVESVEQ